ncbi:MAG: phage holin family protein [Ruminococcus sp.]|nr:phage holin family protein [Ruminococcus sp.]
MITIVLGLALADIVTGWIKAHVNDDYSSKVMRKGGLNKICELVVMTTACGLEVGIGYLGRYYRAEALAGVTGTVAAIAVFGYITIMEIISILENYGEADPNAAGWIKKLLKKLRSFDDENKT